MPWKRSAVPGRSPSLTPSGAVTTCSGRCSRTSPGRDPMGDRRTGPPMGSRTLARWCEQHGRWECTKPRSRGRGQCHAQAIKGTGACPAHAGKTIEQARRDAVNAWAAMPDDQGITPLAAAAGQLNLSWRRAQLLGDELRRQVEAASGGNGGGLVGYVYSASAASDGIYPASEQVRALVKLEAEERERCV